MNGEMIERFWDKNGPGGFYFTANDAERLPVRRKEIYDGALPSGNSVAALNQLRLGRITGDPGLEEKAVQILRVFSDDVGKAPMAFTQLRVALDFGLGPSVEVVVAGKPGALDTRQMFGVLWSVFLPNKVVLFRPEGEDLPPVASIAKFTASQRAIGGRATAYVCQDYNCKLPTTDPAQMMKMVAESTGESP